MNGTGDFGQLSFAHMPVRLFACTPSRLAAFECPRRYRFTYVERPPLPRGPPWAHNTVGATVHVALHRWWLQPRARRTPDEGARLVVRYWRDLGFRDAAQSDRVRADAAEWVRRYLHERVDPEVEPVAVERAVSARTQRLAVSGRADRIDVGAGPDELVVVDYKTGPRPRTPVDAERSRALAFYVLGVRETMHRACRRVELHHVPTGSVAAFDHTEATLADHVARAEDVAARIISAQTSLAAGAAVDDAFPPRPGPECGWCDFRRHCPTGQEAAPAQDPWAGLAPAQREA